MARQRDYKAEYAARKARAQASGYGSYWQERKTKEASKRGGSYKPSAPRAASSRKTQAANKRAQSAGFRNDYDFRKTRAKARSTSDAKAVHNSAVFDPSSRPSGMTVAQYTKAYSDAWIKRDKGSRGDFDARQYWYAGMWNDYGEPDEWPDWYDDELDRYQDQ